jgi:tetratricopeptide (TPR) repeat protein
MAGSRRKRHRSSSLDSSSKARHTTAGHGPLRVALCSALIVTAGILAYANSLSVPFHYDDSIGIVENSQIRRLWPITVPLSPPSEGQPVSGRPVANLSLAVNYAIGGLDVTGYHVVNIALHIGCALLLFGIVRQTLRLPAFQGGIGKRSDWFALASALIWLLHPLQTQAVSYISARTESLMGLFYLLTLYSSIRAGQAGLSANVRRERAWTAAAIASCALGMASKESIVTAPLMVLLYDKTYLYGSLKRALMARRALYGGLAVTGLLLVWLIWEGPRSEATGFTTGLSPWTYLLNQSVIITEYLRRAIWPRSLVFDYGETLPLSFGDVALAFAFIAVLVGGALWMWIVRPTIGYLGIWFFVTLAPTSSLVPILTEVGEDRRMYLPMAALAVLAVAGLFSLRDRLARPWEAAGQSARKADTALAVALGAACLALTLTTVSRNREYQSGLTLWQTTVERWPSARAHRNVAAYLITDGRQDDAIFHLRQAVETHPEARYVLGSQLLELERFPEAEAELQAYLRAVPEDVDVPRAREALGRALVAQGRLEEATEQFKAILAVDPDDATVHFLIADVLEKQGDLPGAARHFRELLTRQPDNPAGWNRLGTLLVQTQQVDEAREAFQRAISLDEDNAYAHANLANILAGRREFEDAIRHARLALASGVQDPAVHHVLGVALLGQGKIDEAIIHLKESLTLDAANPEAQSHLALALKLKGR